MKVENYSYETFPSYDEDIDGIIELKGKKDNLRCRMKDVEYQDGCIIRFLFPHTILDEKRKYPLVIHVQGSGWYKQDMADHIFDFMPIVKSGIAYAIIQYRHSPQFHFPTQIIDTKKAIRFIERHADQYPIDISQLFLSGDSSGGHTALMTLFTYNQGLFDIEKSILPPLKGCIDLYGVTHFLTMNDWYSKYHYDENSSIDFMGKEHIDEESMEKASPINYIEQNESLPPILILHGSKDHVVPFTQSIELYQKLKEYHFDVQLARVKDADHGRSIFYVDDVYQCLINFIKSHL
ncbi:MAG: alpha/beta hydrolase fold domain-containing protein [Faecalibacillus sp.]